MRNVSSTNTPSTKRTSCRIARARPVTRNTKGPGPMEMVASLQCATCHNNSEKMEVAAQRGMQLPPGAFHHRHPHPAQQVVFELPRPPQGFTKTFSSFWDGHPEFQIKNGERARSRRPALQSSTPFRARHSAGERTETRLQLLPQAATRRPLLSTHQFRGQLSGLSFTPVRREKSGDAHSAWKCRSCPDVSAHVAGAIRRLRAFEERSPRRRSRKFRRPTDPAIARSVSFRGRTRARGFLHHQSLQATEKRWPRRRAPTSPAARFVTT